MNSLASTLTLLLNQWVDRFNKNGLVDEFEKLILEALIEEDNPTIFAQIASDVWDKYSCVDIEIMISVLRRWLAIDPESAEAKHALGSYLLIHGPDWDAEAKSLLEESG